MKRISFVIASLVLISAGPSTLGTSSCDALQGAESKFVRPQLSWLANTQHAVRLEAADLEQRLDKEGTEYATAWKKHLHWNLLGPNIDPNRSPRFDQLLIVRRWLYSNKEGLEGPYFSDIRKAMDNYLEATFTFAHPDLQSTFIEKLGLARQQCAILANNPTEENGIALGKTLGWFEMTHQLTAEIAALRKQVSYPNAQLSIANSFIQRAVKGQLKPVSQTNPVSNTVMVPSGLFGGMKETSVSGTATTSGRVSVKLVPNQNEAQIDLVFNGTVFSNTQGSQGNVVTFSQTSGPVVARKPFFLTPEGLRLGETTVNAQVSTHITGVSAGIPFVEGIALKRANRPDVRSTMSRTAHIKTNEQLRDQFTTQVENQLESVQNQNGVLQEKLSGFMKLLAPVEREGATPAFVGSRSSANDLDLQFSARTPFQFAAVSECPKHVAPKADAVACFHQSFFNNMAETIMTGKNYSDTYFMETSKALQPELPLELMVHSRAKRWGVSAEVNRPLNVEFKQDGLMEISLRLQAFHLERQRWETPIRVISQYRSTKDDYEQTQLERQGDIVFKIDGLPEDAQVFFKRKMEAFWAPILNGGGVILPDGGLMGALKGIEFLGMTTSNGWMLEAFNIPQSVLKAVKELNEKPAE